MAKQVKWTRAARDRLFKRVVQKFGPFDTWETSNSPASARQKEFDKFCADFAKTVGAKSGKAVKMQIRFGSPTTKRSEWKAGHVRNAILCLAAALEAGFIGNKHLPNLTARAK